MKDKRWVYSTERNCFWRVEYDECSFHIKIIHILNKTINHTGLCVYSLLKTRSNQLIYPFSAGMNVKEFCVSTSAQSGRQLIGGEISLSALYGFYMAPSVCVCVVHTHQPIWPTVGGILFTSTVHSLLKLAVFQWKLWVRGNSQWLDWLSVWPTCAHLIPSVCRPARKSCTGDGAFVVCSSAMYV